MKITNLVTITNITEPLQLKLSEMINDHNEKFYLIIIKREKTTQLYYITSTMDTAKKVFQKKGNALLDEGYDEEGVIKIDNPGKIDIELNGYPLDEKIIEIVK